MRLLRCISAIALALAVTLGGSGYVPMPSDAQAMADSGRMAAMPPDQPMPDCPMCAPDGAVSPMCATSCAALTAILPLSAVAPLGSMTRRQALSSPRRLADAAVGPEPHPPRPTILS
jgi:hypothetical protein